jgi:hypothetical protein
MMSACDLSVKAPHLVLDEYLDDPKALPAIVAGVRGDFAAATANATGGVYHAGALLTDELVHVGTFLGFRGISDGIVKNDYVEANTWWGWMSRARWVAEDAQRRIIKWFREGAIDSATAIPNLARVSLYAGHANRVLADHFDFAVIDGGPRQSREVFYARALEHFNAVIALMASPHISAALRTEIEGAAYGGRAQVYMNLRDWTRAVADAGRVPTAYVYNQIHATSPDRERNMFAWWANLREESSVWGTPFATWGRNRTPTAPGNIPTEGDPRVEYDIATTPAGAARLGGDARRPFWRQFKYPGTAGYAIPIPIVKGTEMRLIEAEARLLAGDKTGMATKINEVRTYHRTRTGGFPTLPLLDVATVAAMTDAAAWALLMKERGIELWLEGRRVGDLRRWAVTPGTAMVPFTVVREAAAGQPPANDPRRHVITSANPGLYLMVSKHEFDSNPNLR